MSLIIQKFGGSSVASVEVIQKTAHHVMKAREQGHQVVVVVSAMSGVTSQLIEHIRQMSVLPDPREYDVVASAGEQVTSGLMALALKNLGVSARSWLAWQVPILSHDTFMKSQIKEIPLKALSQYLDEGGVPVIAGFQAITKDNHLTTLGRGGSDMTAVALAAALQADHCDLYKDVEGVYTADPHIVSKARKIDLISYEEMRELASQGAKVLQPHAVEMAIQYKVPLRILSTFQEAEGTRIVAQNLLPHPQGVRGIVCNRDEAKIVLLGMSNPRDASQHVFGPLSTANIHVGMVAQHHDWAPIPEQSLLFTVPRTDMQQAIALTKNRQAEIGFQELRQNDQLAKISVVGSGLQSNPTILTTLMNVLNDKHIKTYGLSTSDFNISLLIEDDYAELMVRALHTVFKLDKDYQDDKYMQTA